MLETKNQTLQEVIGNGHRYVVPPFQRDYSWDREQWEDLWNDIEVLDVEEEQHYMGYLVLQKTDNRSFKIIDGQQRITTLSLLILAVIRNLQGLIEVGTDVDANTKRVEEFRRDYVGRIDTVSLVTENKLILNRNNDSSFKSIAADLEYLSERKQKNTNKLLNNAYKFFVEKFTGMTGEDLARFVAKIKHKLLFTQITVDDDINAYKVFETLNARGVQLSTADLLKNYLFSVISKSRDIPENELDILDEKWAAVVEQLGKNDFSQFLRTDWNSKYPITTKNQLFKNIRKKITDRAEAYAYFHNLEENAPIYAALQDSEDELWRTGEYKDVQRCLKALEVFNIKQPHNLLLEVYKRFDLSEFVKLCSYLEKASIRYNAICNNQANEQERVYNKLSIKVASGNHKRASHVKNDPEFRKIYPSDEDFSGAFQYKALPSRRTQKKIKYLLHAIEAKISNKSYDEISGTLEHILPYNPTSEWRSYFGNDDCDDAVDRLGNIILLAKPDNNDADREPFEVKRKIYEGSGYIITKKVAEFSEWNRETLNEYQKWLAQKAIETWEICWD